MTKHVNADKIIWTGNTLDELRRLLGGEPEIEFEELLTSGLDYPWPITIKQVIYTVTEEGPAVDIILEFEPIVDASEYRVRTALIPTDSGDVWIWTGITNVLTDITKMATNKDYTIRYSFTNQGPPGAVNAKSVMIRGIDPSTITPVDALGWMYSVYWGTDGIEYDPHWFLHVSGPINDPAGYIDLGAAVSSPSTAGAYPQVTTLKLLGDMTVPGPYSITTVGYDYRTGKGDPFSTPVSLGDTGSYVLANSRPIVALGLDPAVTGFFLDDTSRQYKIYEVDITWQGILSSG